MLAVLLTLLVAWQAANVQNQETGLSKPKAEKYLVLDLEDQKIYRFEDGKLLDLSRVCTGRGWHNAKTKRKRYRDSYLIVAKQGAHARSTIPGKYNLKTPYKFILSPTVSRHGERMHGFAKVPHHPASHGCIRLPLSYAKKIHPWVEPGKTKLFVKLHYEPQEGMMVCRESRSRACP